ncbi:hypothetical protein LTR78_003722 [Recurvomyces mirabilis]|uniref:Uncharacterized protein n=1 Tax=Recurvomyces mirabilis TaxID=574656 RepID=A0AAE0WR33_9PEZI|nr:hypothetical protein LTR78_003722 [Recurvomyces mirabilis]KAK5154834.1 hypothetical protein LTS14_006415 [Recurvomyces mirabilis]
MASMNLRDHPGPDDNRTVHYTSAVTVREVQDQLIAGKEGRAVWLRSVKHHSELSALTDFPDDVELEMAIEYLKRRTESRLRVSDVEVELVLNTAQNLQRKIGALDARSASQEHLPRRSKKQWQKRLDLLDALDQLYST